MSDRSVHTALSEWERPHVSLRSDGFSASVTVAELDVQSLRTVARELDLIVENNLLITAHKNPLSFYDHVLARAGTDPDLIRLDSGFLLYILLDELLEHYESLETHVQGQIEQMQARALRDSSEDFLEELLQFKRYAFGLGQLAQQHQSVFQAFLRPDFPFISGEEISDYFRNLEHRLMRLISRLDGARQEANNTFDIYLSHQSHRTNEVMKTLTVVATILFGATFIEGIFGPSFRDIPTHDPAGFPVMLALIALLAVVTLYVFRRRGWM